MINSSSLVVLQSSDASSVHLFTEWEPLILQTSVFGGSAGRFGLVGIVPLLLMSNWRATWIALTRHGGVDEAGLLENFLIVLHALRLLWVMLVVVMISFHLFLLSTYTSIL